MRILVIRFSSLGDCVLLCPFLAWLKASGADEVAVVTKRQYLELFTATTGVDRVVALDTTHNLVRSVSGRQVRLRLAPGGLPPVLEPIRVQSENGTHLLALNDYPDLERVLAALREAGIGILEMELVQPDLEDVFVQIMRKA